MEIIIDENYNDVRLDRFLRKFLPDTALTEIFKGIRTGKIKVNGKKSKENARLKTGDIVKVFFPEDQVVKEKKEENIQIDEKEIENIKKSIVYEDDHIIVINKKHDLVMHAGSGHEYGLAEILKSYLKTPDFNFVNRIDKATSGLVIGAKDLPTARLLSEEIRENRVEKKYYILVDGSINTPNFTKKTYLKKTDEKVIESETFLPGFKESVSHFKVLRKSSKYTLLQGELDSGRTHQLRVQLASMGHPIVGDKKYGGSNAKRMMLHSFYVNIKKLNLKLELPIPEEFKIN